MYLLKYIPTQQLGYRWAKDSPAVGLSPGNERWYPVVEEHLRAGTYPKDQRSAHLYFDQVWPVADSYRRLGRFINHLIVYQVQDDRFIVSVGNRRLCVARAFDAPKILCLITTEWNDPNALDAVPYKQVKLYDPSYTHQ